MDKIQIQLIFLSILNFKCLLAAEMFIFWLVFQKRLAFFISVLVVAESHALAGAAVNSLVEVVVGRPLALVDVGCGAVEEG